jgi:hypothetical protein
MSVARGGANAARPEDATAIATDPAGLAFLPGHTVMVDLTLPVQKMCVDPYGFYGWGQSDSAGSNSEFGNSRALRTPDGQVGYAGTPLGAVCNSANSVPLPQAGWAGPITKNLSLGFGFLEPVLVPGMQFGGGDGTVQTPYGARPTPTRYTLIKQEALYASAPSFAAAYRFIPELAAGLTLQVVGISARQTQVQHPTVGTSPSTDFLATITTQDLFIPALTFSVHARPIPALNLMASFKWSDDFRGSGDVVYETNTYFRGPGLENAPFKNDPVRLSGITVPLPWLLTAGARYAGLLHDKDEKKRGDPMGTERWDVEVDFNYSFDKRTSTDSATLGQDVTLVTHQADGGVGASQKVSATDVGTLNASGHLQNSYALRLGGSYSFLPRKLAVNAGLFYESRGVDLAYADITSMAFQRVGASIGMVFRFGSWDLRLGAMHIASETIEVAPAPKQDQFLSSQARVSLPDPDAPPAARADAVAAKHQTTAAKSPIINAGRYTASFDVLSAGFAYHF